MDGATNGFGKVCFAQRRESISLRLCAFARNFPRGVTLLWCRTSYRHNQNAMIKNYLKTGFRNLWKNKGFSAINIIGLATGLAVCLMIALYVIDELNYDRHHEKADRIYRIDADIYFNNTAFIATVTPEPMGP